ncbi:hypothetical protein HanRHA438_Chr08g0352121 [Helianthus annuus]|nr:hypothetical protein HanRHA438_Chr08g0352121 [Helianthus annuus]
MTDGGEPIGGVKVDSGGSDEDGMVCMGADDKGIGDGISSSSCCRTKVFLFRT